MTQWAMKQGIKANIFTETEVFLDYHRAKGSKFKDWDSSWRNWMRRADTFTPKQPTQKGYDWNDTSWARSLEKEWWQE